MKWKTFAIIKNGEYKREIIPAWDRSYGCEKFKNREQILKQKGWQEFFKVTGDNMCAFQNMPQYYKTGLQIFINKNILETIFFNLSANKKLASFRTRLQFLRARTKGRLYCHELWRKEIWQN